MDYEEDLNAPVWDELGDKNEVPDELSTSFKKLSTGENTPETKETAASEGVDLTKDSSKIEWRSEDDGTPLKESLLEELAPQEDTLPDFQTSKDGSGITSPSKTKDEPLFSGSTFLPLIENEDENLQNSETHNASSTNTNRHSAKPQVLFKSARIRRRPLSIHPDPASQRGTQTRISDPLGESKKEAEFVEESLEEQEPHGSGIARNNTILEQVDEPLFTLSPKKSTTNGVGETTGVDDLNDGETAETNKKLVKFTVEVKDPVKVGELTSAHVEYTVVAESELIDGKYAQVNRRYTDFRWLYRQLQNNHWGTVIPPPPEKQTVGRFKQDFIENRRFQMERMLCRIASTIGLQDDPDFIMFLTSATFAQDAKKREHSTGSAASNDNNDLSEIHISEIELLGIEDATAVLKSGGIDGESQKRFMSISFSSLPKYVESDEFFSEQWQHADTLEERLRQLDKSLELVDSERNELASVTEEFAKTIESLAALEVTKKSSDLLFSFAETHRRIKESLERGSLQEAMTLGAVLDEYTRLLSSLKAVFNQRAKLGLYLVIVESELSKKHAQWGKLLNSSNQGANDKVSTAKNEISTLQRRVDLIKKSWQDVGHQIKKQVGLFEVEKIKDFRNSMEIFLESAIEAQKEAIELWETFYQNNL